MRSPVLLIGAGTGEATCGILYLASYLRRHGVEAFVRLTDDDETAGAMRTSLEQLIARVKPQLIGISLKWFHHVARAVQLAKMIRAIDPAIAIAMGGNSASFWWQDLIALDCVDHVVLGDGEVPLLSLARGDAVMPNVVGKGATKAPLDYVQGADSADVHYSHFADLFLSQRDRHSFSGWVAPGKGCGENCLYCSGTRGMQKATFGRAIPFLRPEASVQRDHAEIAAHTWQLRYDFAGSTAKFLKRAWGDVDLSQKCATYFLWGVPPPDLAATLAGAFERVYMVLDIGCFSESQRVHQMAQGLLKPCPTDAQLFEVIADSQRHPNLKLEVSGIAGLPWASPKTLAQEEALVAEVIGRGCAIGYQRLESQPGALATEHPERFEMHSEARTFAEFLRYFEERPEGEKTVPMIRYRDAKLEAQVQATSDAVDAMVWDAADAARAVRLTPKTKLARTAVVQTYTLADWLGPHAPKKHGAEKVTVARGTDGAGLACVPSVKRLPDPSLQTGAEAAQLLAALDAFAKPATVEAALKKLKDPDAEAMIAELAAQRFLAPSG